VNSPRGWNHTVGVEITQLKGGGISVQGRSTVREGRSIPTITHIWVHARACTHTHHNHAADAITRHGDS